MGEHCFPKSCGREELTSWVSGWRLADALRFKELAYLIRLAAMTGFGLRKANEIGFWDSSWNCLRVAFSWVPKLKGGALGEGAGPQCAKNLPRNKVKA